MTTAVIVLLILSNILLAFCAAFFKGQHDVLVQKIKDINRKKNIKKYMKEDIIDEEFESD